VRTKITVERNLIYGSTEKELLNADVYRPVTEEEVPVVILLHGGGWQSGSKEMYAEWGPFLAESGYAAVAINYRLSTPSYATWPGVLEDVRAAVNFIVGKANEWKLDPLKMAFIGDSAGAHLAAMYALENPCNASHKIQAVVGVYGVYDLAEQFRYNLPLKKNNIRNLMGGSPDEHPEAYRAASPIHRVEEALAHPAFDTKFLIIWGELDQTALPAQSKRFAARLQELNCQVQTCSIPDQAHFWFNRIPEVPAGTLDSYPNQVIIPELMDFLDSHVKQSLPGNFSGAQVKKLQQMFGSF